MREPSVNRMRMPWFCADRAVDRVGVGEVVGGLDGAGGELRAGQGGELGAEVVHEAVGGFGCPPPRSRGGNSSCGRRWPSARGRCRAPAACWPARMLSQSSTAQSPSFSRTWLEPVPALSSPQIVAMPASSRLPKNFQPVGVSKQGTPSCSATRSAAPLVGIERAMPLRPAW